MRSNKSEEQVVHYVGRLQLAGKALEDVRAILEDLANQPVPARLIVSVDEDAKDKVPLRASENTYIDEEGMSGSIGVGLKTVEGR